MIQERLNIVQKEIGNMNKKKIRNEILIIGMWENRQTETNRQMDRQTKQKEI